MSSRFLFAFTLLVLSESSEASAVFAQESTAPADSDSTSPTNPAGLVEKAVADLGAPSFEKRQAAAAQLLQVDSSELPLLIQASKSSSEEVAKQLEVLLPRIRKRLFEAPLENFREEPSVENAARLPGWNRMVQVAGESDSTRVVFQEMVLAERELFAGLMFTPDAVPSLLEVRGREIQQQMNRAGANFPMASVMALMLLGSDADVRLVRDTASNINAALPNEQFVRLVHRGVHAETMRAVTESWLLRSHPVVDHEILFTTRHKWQAGRELAVRILDSTRRNSVVAHSLLCLGQLDRREDLERVESRLTAEDVVWPTRGQTVDRLAPGSGLSPTYQVRVGDIALAVAIHLRDGDPGDFGMQAVRSSETLFQFHSLGFADDATRQEALRRYQQQFLQP